MWPYRQEASPIPLLVLLTGEVHVMCGRGKERLNSLSNSNFLLTKTHVCTLYIECYDVIEH